MKKSIQIIIIFLIIVLIIATYFLNEKKNKKLLVSVEDKIIFFFGEGCPHCAKVEEFFKANNVESKVQFDKKEIYSDKENAYLLKLIANKKCNLSENEIGVPFLWDGSKCLIGDKDIINFFQEKISEK